MTTKTKLKLKSWSCNNECGSDCCSNVYIRVSNLDQLKMFLTRKELIIDESEYEMDWDWFRLQHDFEVIPLEKGKKMIRQVSDIKPEIKVNPYSNRLYLFFKDALCSKLMPSGRCAVYRTRPKTCKYSPCIFKNDNPMVHWFGEDIRKRKADAKDNS